jgi:GNAT superfamily N-acetyltransferase
MDTVVAPLAEAAPLEAAALPAEWATWAEEPGQRISVREGGRMLGTLHVVVVGRDEAWLDGLWVEPAARGLGVARRLVNEAEAIAARYGVTLIRAVVPASDETALAVANRMKFAQRSRAVVGIAELVNGSVSVPRDPRSRGEPVRPEALPRAHAPRVNRARPADVAPIISFVGSSPSLASWQGLIPLGWRFRQLRPELVRGLVNDGRVLRSGAQVEGAAAYALRGSDAVVAFLDGPPAHRQALYDAIADAARAAGARRIALFMPEGIGAEGIRAAVQPHPWCPDGLVIVERRIGSSKNH